MEHGAESHEAPAWLNTSRLYNHQTALLALLQASLARLNSLGVPCWITGGTLLGALRHGGFVPHDDDLDLECLEADLDKIRSAFDDHPLLVFRKGGHWNTTPVAHIGLRNGAGGGSVEIELDIFLREDPLVEHKDLPSAQETFPLADVEFHGLKVPAPGSAEPFLRRMYGQDCLDTVRVWSHDFNQFHSLAHNPNRVLMTLEAYTALVLSTGYQAPVLPPGDVEECLRSLVGEGGIMAAITAEREETWLDKLQRRNREQAEAREALARKS
eukprot:TRINITY_DN63619_c0_g1_i1.p1 TRINITY_DN63619_c0_g1~~TRINITY_DN63619_c0_g1_i1.p1  ORF type:complete len:270 (-),score=28.82 TRINITY_DN63619_c0_g1_i1:148-957(-)